MHLLFFLPTSHFSIFLISHLIYHIHSLPNHKFKIYIILETTPSTPIHELWIQYIQSYHLQYLYPPSTPFLHFLEFHNLKNPQIISFLQQEIHHIFFHLPSFPFLHSFHSIPSLSKIIFSLQKPISLCCDIDSIHPSFPFHKLLKKHFFHKITPKSSHKIFYLPISLGEDERGIISQHTLPLSLFSLFQQKQSLPSILSLSSFSSIFPIFFLIFQQKYEFPPHIHQFLFLNTSLPSFHSSNSSQPPKWILSHFDKYHDSLAKLLQKNKKIHQIHYHQLITSETYLRKLDYHLKEPILPPKHIDVFSSLISFISLNIISLTVFMIILAYHYIENKQYILLLLFILLWKIPPIFHKMKEYLKKSISSVFEYYSGRIHFDEESKIEENESYIYMWNPHRMVPLGSFLSICSQEFQMKIKDKKKIHHVTHPFIHYYPFVSPLFDIFQFQTCSRENIESILDKKESIGIWLGGVKEMNIKPNAEEEQIYVSSRKGIFEIALKTGTSIIPSYTFGEINIYSNQMDSIHLPFFNLSLPFPSLSFLQKEINNLFQIFRTKPDYFTVIGKPIQVTKKDIITEDDINELKKIYIEELMHLYEKYKSVRYFYPKHLTIL